MAVPFSNSKLRVPQGFQSLLEGVAKEVLQMQPNDIFAFSAVYFENLLQLRESGVVDPVAHMSRIQDRMYNNKAFQKPDVDLNNHEQQDAAIKIQTKYRQHQSKAVVDQMRQDKAATKIQAGIRGYLGRKRVTHLRREMVTSAEQDFNADDGNDLQELRQEDEFNINEDDEETARTHESTDRELAEVEPEDRAVQKSPVLEEDGYIDIDLTDPEVQLAATKIQAGFRGMHTRQHLKTEQHEEAKDRMKEDQIIRDEGEDAKALEEQRDVEAREEEAERSETPETKLEMSVAQENLTKEEHAEMEFSEDDPEMIEAIAEIQNSFRRMKDEVENEDEDVASDELKNLEMEAAATKIQAGFKGMKTRRELEVNKREKKGVCEERKEMQPEDVGNLAADSEVTSAANRIQAGFRGYKTRKEVQRLKSKKHEELASREERKEENEVHEKIDNDEDEKRAAAASKIQAGFKGYKTRKDLEIHQSQKADVNKEKEEEERYEEQVEDGEKQTEEAGDELEQEPEAQEQEDA